MKTKQTEGQMDLMSFRLSEVKIRLKIAEGEPLYSTEALENPTAAKTVMSEMLRQLDREYCAVVNLDCKLRPINYNIVSIGGINSAPVPVQNIFKAAIMSNAASIMLFHNHPSGNPEPSFEDMVLTKRFIEVGELMGIPAVDHIIVGGGSGEIYSFRENTDLFSKNSRSKEAKESEKIKESVRQDRRSVIGKLSEKKKELEENRLFEKAGHETKRTHEEVRN